MFECSDSLFARDSREIVESLAAFKIVEQVLEGHTSAAEDRRTPEDFVIFNDYIIQFPHRDINLKSALLYYTASCGGKS